MTVVSRQPSPGLLQGEKKLRYPILPRGSASIIHFFACKTVGVKTSDHPSLQNVWDMSNYGKRLAPLIKNAVENDLGK
jgi:hypothetical protein